jgi:hypothetical protein
VVPAFALVGFDLLGRRSILRWTLAGLAYLLFATGPSAAKPYLAFLGAGVDRDVRSVQYLAGTVLMVGLICAGRVRVARPALAVPPR